MMTVRGIGKVFGDQQALAEVSFEVVSGEILGLIGPNGAGKTTLLECIAGLLPTDTGEVRWRGSPLPPARRKERLFYVPEAILPYPDQRTAEVLTFFQQAHRQPPSRLEQLVRTLGLEPALTKPVGVLSKGYRRRFLLALGLLAPRPVLLMDEPFDGFDLRQTREVMNLLREEAADGRTLVLSIHQLGDAQRICDRLVLLSGGRGCRVPLRHADRLFDIIRILRAASQPVTAAAIAAEPEITVHTGMSRHCRRVASRSRAQPASGMGSARVRVAAADAYRGRGRGHRGGGAPAHAHR